MGPLRFVYNVASNKPARFHDDPDAESDLSVTPPNGQLDVIATGSNERATLLQPDRWSPGNGIGGSFPKLPYSFSTRLDAAIRWIKGPSPPRPWRITPVFAHIQSAPVDFIHYHLPAKRHKCCLLLAFYALWLLVFATLLRASAFSAEVPGYGPPTRLSCEATFWFNKNGCGINGNGCRPFDNATIPFRCPADCLKSKLLNPHAVGPQEIVYRPLVVGGSSEPGSGIEDAIYRADSFICGSAIHAGLISDSLGGCGIVSLIGEHTNYPSVTQNGISSIGFDSNFPKSFKFLASPRSDCRDLRWTLLGVSVTFSALLSICITSSPVFFFSIFTALFFHVALVSDPPNAADYYALISTAFGRFLPSAFVMFVVYKYCVSQSLTNLHAPMEKTVLWLGACWVGVLNNHTFDKIPIQRLTPHDIHHQPGAIPALITIVLAIFFIALGQAWAIRIEGKMPFYLGLYSLLVAGILVLLAVPRMKLRIHHYILGLLLVPGTAMQNRPSLLFQGLLIGLFMNGIARWGYDSILQTSQELLGDGQIGNLLPIVAEPLASLTNITFTWQFLANEYDGMSILVNDVERFRKYRGSQSFTWTRSSAAEENGTSPVPQYFRFGYMKGREVGDYTRAGTWNVDGSWTRMADGPSVLEASSAGVLQSV